MSAESILISMSGGLAALAGLAALLRSRDNLTTRSVASSILNSGLFGIAVCAVALQWYTMSNYWMILAASVLAGLGGNKALEFGLTLAMFVADARLKGNGKRESGNGT